MYNSYQLKGTLRHEKQHQEDQKNHKHYDDKNLRHAEIVGEEMSHQDFKNSTKEYQKAQAEQLNRYLNKVNDKNTDLYKKLKQLYYDYR